MAKFIDILIKSIYKTFGVFLKRAYKIVQSSVKE